MKMIAVVVAVGMASAFASVVTPQDAVENLSVNLLLGLGLVGSAFGTGFAVGRYLGIRQERDVVRSEEIKELREELTRIRKGN